VLLRQHARGERVLAVVRIHRHGGLDDDGAVVERRRDEVHRAAVHAAAGFEGAAVGVQAGEGRQQRGMDVHQAALVAPHEILAEDAHEAGQHDEVGRVAVDLGGQRGIEQLARGMFGMRHHGGGNAVGAGRLQPLGIALLLITAAMRQGSCASSMASMLLPRPEMRMTMLFMSELDR
jgi:hypothetical protein